MHNIDRNILETSYEGESYEGENYEGESFETGNFEYEQYEMPGETNYEWSGEGESYEYEEEGVFNEAELMELASELLEVQDEAELDQFLGKLLRSAGRAIGKVVKSPIGKALGGVLKGAIKNALPLAGGALGTMVGGPLGGMIGRGVANAAGSALGLEYEGEGETEGEDREFEGAKKLVEFVGSAVRNMPPNVRGDLQNVAQYAVTRAAQNLVPGLLPGNASRQPGRGSFGQGKHGRWVRRGNQIILFGA